MLRPSIRTILCVILVVLGGCLAGGAGQSPSSTTTPICKTVGAGDPKSTMCLVAERPPDIEYQNLHSKSHSLSVRIIRDNSTVVFSDTVEIEGRVGETVQKGVWKNVLDTPGTYTIKAIVNNTQTDTVVWTVDKRYDGEGNVDWIVAIQETGNPLILRQDSI